MLDLFLKPMRRKNFFLRNKNTRSIRNHFREQKNNPNFVDKSLFIKDILDNRGIDVSVIMRPKLSGKTSNLSMLHHFLSENVNGKSTKDLFNHLKISQCGDKYMQQSGQIPGYFIIT